MNPTNQSYTDIIGINRPAIHLPDEQPPLFPFSAIVGQEKVKKALLLNCICPTIGGALLSGEKGTAKSTVVRSLSALLPEMNVITLPLNATEDMVLGGIDMEVALKQGEIAFQPGLLSKANGHILYIDEVNLMSEALINTILDAAASGQCTIQREGISHTYPSTFILVGSMNPEEGSLKPQILDRFGFFAEVKGESNVRTRMEIVRNRLAYERDPWSFAHKFCDIEKDLEMRIKGARQRLSLVKLRDEVIELIADICYRSFIAGHRGDLALCNGVLAHAALEGRQHVTREDIEVVQHLALAHRIRSAQLPQQDEDNEPDSQNQEEPENDQSGDQNKEENSQNQEPPQQNQTPDIPMPESKEDDNNVPAGGESEEAVFEIGQMNLRTDLVGAVKDKHYRTLGSGRRSKTRTSTKQGHYIKVKRPKGAVKDLAFDATLRAAAPFQYLREKNGTAICIKQQDIREKIREKRIGHTVLFLLDTSGSMGINRRMSEAKAAVFELLKESYKKRDTVGLMTFNHHSADIVLQPTRSLDLAHKSLKEIKTGGRTPLAEGLDKSMELMKALQRRNNEIIPVICLLSDGRANYSTKSQNPMEAVLKVAQKSAKEKIRYLVIDTETGFIRLGLAKKLASELGAEYYNLDELKNIREIVDAGRYM